ncbi:MAG: hypothetical protein KC620_20280, partial [Myxococcales bacterium]|nr:hypothetical protein [Myxococcales bacterium]
MTERSPIARRGPSVARRLLAVNGFILLVPVLAVVLLRIYEGSLVRQTEERLIAEAALIGEAWRARLLEIEGISASQAPRIQPPNARDERFFPYDPVLPLDPEVLDPEPPALRHAARREGAAWLAGERIKPLLDRAKLVNLSGARVLDAEGCV